MEALSDRQMAALHARANHVRPVVDDFDEGTKDAALWLARQLADYPTVGMRFELRKVLREYAVNQIQRNASEYEDGHAVVLDDVLAILDGNQDVIGQWTAVAELKLQQAAREA